MLLFRWVREKITLIFWLQNDAPVAQGLQIQKNGFMPIRQAERFTLYGKIRFSPYNYSHSRIVIIC